MKVVSKFIFIVATVVFPAVASASVEALSFSCSSSLVVSVENGYQASCDGDFSFDSGVLFDNASISITASGLLNIGQYAVLAAPDIRLFAHNVTVDGRLSALSGIIEINSPNSVELGVTAKLDSKSTGVSVVGYPDFYETKPSLPHAGSITIGNGAEITHGSFNSTIGLLSGMQGQSGVIEITSFPSVCGGCPAILLPAVAQVPEPSNFSMLAMGLLAISLVVRRKAKQY